MSKINIPNPIVEKYKLPNGDIATRNYRIGKELGRGGFATCFEIIDLTTNFTHACKLVQKSTLGRSHSK